MQTLEEQVRNAIVQRKTQDMFTRFYQSRFQKRYQAMFSAVSEEVYQQFADTEYGTKLTDEEVKEHTKLLLVPENIQALIKEYYLSIYNPDEYEIVRGIIKFFPGITEKLTNAENAIEQSRKSSLQVLVQLTETAQTRGVPYVCSQEAEDAVLKKLFPSVSAYREYVAQTAVRREVEIRVKELVAKSELMAHMNPKIPKPMQEYIAAIYASTCIQFHRLFKEIEREQMTERISVIYGD
jgi:hypothetical protein